MEKRQAESATASGTVVAGRAGGVRAHLWRVLRLIALWGNLVYAGGFLVVIGILVGLGPAPWRAYANVAAILAIAGVTPLMNVRAARRGLKAVAAGIAVALNLSWLGYLLLKPEYSTPAIGLLVGSVPLSNIAVILVRLGRRPAAPDRM